MATAKKESRYDVFHCVPYYLTMSRPSLALAPFEHYMLLDDRPDYPMAFVLKLTFSGPLERERLRHALRASLRLHPLLHWLVPGDRGKSTSRLRWAPSPVAPVIRSTAAGFKLAKIDLRREPGLVVTLDDNSSTTCWLQFHHSCCDGVGALHFVETLLAFYDDAATPLPSIVEERLRGKAFLVARTRRVTPPERRWGDWVQDGPRTFHFLVTNPAPLSPRVARSVASGPEPRSVFASHTFTLEETAAYQAEARRCAVSVNDLLLRDLYVAIADWRQRRGFGSPNDALRIAVPVNTRGAAYPVTSAVNAASMVFLDRRAVDMAAASLLPGIHAEMTRIKEGRLEQALVGGVRILGMAAPLLKLLLQSPRTLATTVLSNLGVLFQQSPRSGPAGKLRATAGIVLEHVEFYPPIRPLTQATFGIVTYGGMLTIGLNFDGRALTHEEGGDLLAAFASHVQGAARTPS